MSYMNRPYYHKIYADLVRDKFPHKADLCADFLARKDWIAFDVLLVNEILFGKPKKDSLTSKGKKHFSYDETTILKILKYMLTNGLNNTETARKFGMSRNTISKWKEIFKDEVRLWNL